MNKPLWLKTLWLRLALGIKQSLILLRAALWWSDRQRHYESDLVVPFCLGRKRAAAAVVAALGGLSGRWQRQRGASPAVTVSRAASALPHPLWQPWGWAFEGDGKGNVVRFKRSR